MMKGHTYSIESALNAQICLACGCVQIDPCGFVYIKQTKLASLRDLFAHQRRCKTMTHDNTGMHPPLVLSCVIHQSIKHLEIWAVSNRVLCRHVINRRQSM